jgi:hypothetical protein
MADSDLASLTEPERAFLSALNDLGVRYLLVGMSAALVQGARGATEDLDLWFESISDAGIGEAAKRAGGFWVTRSEPPMLGGMSERFDVVTSMSGLPDFAAEFESSRELDIDGVRLRVLPLARPFTTIVARIFTKRRRATRRRD